MSPLVFRWLYKCHPWSSPSSITVGRFPPSPHRLNPAFSAELLALDNVSFFPSPACTALMTNSVPG
ncbi:hypothetical protein DM035_26095 [Salmonella enterica subsp. enterica serovar Kottbus]|uniref:Uncharacterized protein n=1 Tax=Salmonella enterica subsp. enterica serovar Kottbus TaxID=224727 RepID=A0A5U6MHI4_SALET|nr:hypothetical protein [Salmonella enterica subsp. enterica serovar Kottbus]